MLQNIMRDQEFLKIPSEPAVAADASVADDLLDTLRVNHEKCASARSVASPRRSSSTRSIISAAKSSDPCLPHFLIKIFPKPRFSC